MKATYHKHILEFKRPSGTSRGVLKTKETWFLIIEDEEKKGIGECGILRSLSIDDVPEYEETLQWVCANISLGKEALYDQLKSFPSIQFGVEQAFLSLMSENPYILFPSAFTQGRAPIPINGLVWMGEKQYMKTQISDLLERGFDCIKLKIGAIDFQDELDLLCYMRSQFSPELVEIRVDANGAFLPAEALEKLKRLSEYDLHSIEQPIKQGQYEVMSELCRLTPLDIALDEELIGVFDLDLKKQLLTQIQPQYIILKPSLIGGFKGSQEWVDLAESNKIGWWITSALESNIGLNAISQFTYTLTNPFPQGLGTGSLYTNNFQSPLFVEKGMIGYSAEGNWELPYL